MADDLQQRLLSDLHQFAVPRHARGRADGADSVTLTINEVNIGRNAPHRFRLALVTIQGDQASAPVYVSGVDWGLPGFGDTQITKNLQQLLAAGRAPH